MPVSQSMAEDLDQFSQLVTEWGCSVVSSKVTHQWNNHPPNHQKRDPNSTNDDCICNWISAKLNLMNN